RFYVLLIVAANSGTSSNYCANSPLSFGEGTRLTVLEKTNEIKPPTVAIFSPSKQEIQQKKKATLVCLASGFYPDNLNLVWKVNSKKRTEGVGTDEISTSNGSTYSLTSRLRISDQEWFNPLNRFECIAEFFKNESQPIHKFIYGDTGCDIFRENYQRSATAGKFVYIMLIFKSILYGIFVMGMMLWYKVRIEVLPLCTYLS
uniref:Ig-like domain-containing protein n=1 Tax=Meleagris gallopavo TaxID=9103 RepID=G3USQ8_MELGA